jgi:hypothetical protein
VTDGDDDLATYTKEYFPEAIHTVDVMHVVEYLWKAGECLHREGSVELTKWIDEKKAQLYGGKVSTIVKELRRQRDTIPVQGPGNKGRRKRLRKVIRYIAKRIASMNYDELLRRDLEIASGAGEGAIKNVIAVRFDHGGMRWIRERAEALLQLRCIEINGDWDAFTDWAYDALRTTAVSEKRTRRIQQSTPSPLPKLLEAA